LVLGLAGLSASAGVVHSSVVAEHIRESSLFGLFFVALSAFQLGWAALALLRPSRPLYWAAAGVNAAVVLIWVVSRTTGLPIGPGAGVPEPVGRPDVFSIVLEAIIVTASLALLRPISDGLMRSLGRAMVVVAVAAAPATGLVSFAGSSEHGHHAERVVETPHTHHHAHEHGHEDAAAPVRALRRARSTSSPHVGHVVEHASSDWRSSSVEGHRRPDTSQKTL
jgi:hypothetical protein